MAKGKVAKKGGNKKKYNGLLKKKKNKEQDTLDKRKAKLKELNKLKNEQGGDE